jgi:uncharacterized membrane protein YidH (DUF202 family)
MRAQDAGQKALDVALVLVIAGVAIGYIGIPFINGTSTVMWDSPSKTIFNFLIIGAALIILIGIIKHMTE